MNIYILGICGTFMAGIALMAREMGYQVKGSDKNVYPPMSTQLSEAGIECHEGFDPANLGDEVDMFIVGNAVTRGNPQFESILNRQLRYISGPQWLYENVLCDRWVLAVAGTHGKTTTSSMLAWILEDVGLNPGFLIGGISPDLGVSARLGQSPFFVIEADEYDTALFDKRSKFVHYHPRTLILNNLEFDHADIFDNLEAIKKQFHHLIRTVPSEGQILINGDDENLQSTIQMGCWSEQVYFSSASNRSDRSHVTIDENRQIHLLQQDQVYDLELAQSGLYNAMNATAAIFAARHAGVAINESLLALARFSGIKRRQEIIGEVNGIRVIDDFAHHPTAIALTLAALRGKTPGRLIAVLDIRSNTMRMGIHRQTLAESLRDADLAIVCANANLQWDANDLLDNSRQNIQLLTDVDSIITVLLEQSLGGDQIVIMSNGGFDNIHQKLLSRLEAQN